MVPINENGVAGPAQRAQAQLLSRLLPDSALRAVVHGVGRERVATRPQRCLQLPGPHIGVLRHDHHHGRVIRCTTDAVASS